MSEIVYKTQEEQSGEKILSITYVDLLFPRIHTISPCLLPVLYLPSGQL